VDDDERKGVTISDTLGKNAQTATFISEPGVYALVVRSNKPEAKRWV
jgi:prophage antirepressor-like protein